MEFGVDIVYNRKKAENTRLIPIKPDLENIFTGFINQNRIL